MIRKPHFYRFASRLGMINPPWRQEGLNIGVEEGAAAVLSDEFLRTFPDTACDTYQFPDPGGIDKKDIYHAIADYTEKAIAEIAGTIRDGETQVVAGGDHSISLASITALTRRVDPATIGIIRIDSHPDVLDTAFTTTGNFHGMWFRPFLETFDEPSIAAVTAPVFTPDQVIFIGNLDTEEEERRFLQEKEFRTYSSHDLRTNSAAAQHSIASFLSQFAHIHLNIDIDGFDKSVAPATGLPAQAGLLPADTQFLIDSLGRHPSFSVDLVEVNPRRAGGPATVIFAQDLLRTILS